MELIAILILALAISLDGFVVGITYGLRKIKIPLVSLVIISFTSAISVLLSMLLGQGIAAFLSPQSAEILGGLLLVIIGIWLLYQSIKKMLVDQTLNSEVSISNNSTTSDKPLFKFKIDSLGIVIKILRKPVKADFDYSGVISKIEAVFLGLALALDAFGAGIGAAMTGYRPLLTASLVGICKFICLSLGLYFGSKLDLKDIDYKTTLFPGVLLIILGVFKLL